MIKLHNIVAVRQGRTFFGPQGWGVSPGQALWLKGANGAGKSTLLQIIAGLYEPFSGDVERQGHSGYLGHANGLLPSLTVRENLDLHMKLAGRPMNADVISQFQLEPYMDYRADILSAGWQQRTALAAIVMSGSEIWLLDEPEAHLDASGRKILEKVVQSHLQSRGVAVIASHDPMWQTLADQEIML